MNTENFTQLIRAITGRNFTIAERVNPWRDGIREAGETIGHEKTYFVSFVTPLERTVGFDWKTPKSDEKMLRSFITAFSSKYREPNPATYYKDASGYGRNWSDMSPEQQDGAFNHHIGHMFTKDELLKQIEARFACPEIETALNRWGFYETEYGIGIFRVYGGIYVQNAIAKMRGFLASLNVAAREELSEAAWVHRFRIEASRDIHTALLKRFCSNP